MEIIPAILTDDPQELERMIRLCESFPSYAQIDVMDGKFVPSKSITASDLTQIKTFLKMEAHLMIKNPEKYLEDFKKAGCERIVFHLEATPKPLEAIATIRTLNLKVGLALNPETTIAQAEPLFDLVDSVLFLAVNPGFYGSPFIPEVLEKAKELKKKRPNLKIGLDGGLKLANIKLVESTGADFACVGSAIFKQKDPKEAFLKFQTLVSS